jgi:hypothetical protein
MAIGAHDLVARHVAEALKEAEHHSVSSDVVARCLLSEAIRLFRQHRPIDDVAAELIAAADNLDEAEPLAFMRP